MSAMKPPAVKAAFGQAPLTATPTWTDLTSRLRRMTVSRRIGEAGQVVAVLNNRDRALEAEYSGSPYYPNVVPNVRLRFEYKEDNLLDYDTSSAEDGMGTVAATNEGSTVTRTTAQALHGLRSFLMTSTGGAESVVGPPLTTAPASSRMAAAPGDVFSVRASFRAVTTGRSCSVGVRGYDSGGSVVWTPANQGTVTDTTTGWVEAVGVFYVPAGVASIIGVSVVASAPNGEQHYVDCRGVELPTVGPNLIDANSASMETTVGRWVGDAAGTVARTNAQAVLGSWSLGMTCSADTVNLWGARYSSPYVPVVAGRRYLFRWQARSAATARNATTYTQWRNSGGADVGAIVQAGSNFASNTAGWTRGGGVLLAPATATQAEWLMRIQNGSAGEVHYADDAGVHEVTVPAAWSPGVIAVADAYIDALPPSYAYGVNGGDSVVTASCTDITKFLARYPLRPPYELEVEADTPKHWWRLGEAEGQSVIGDRGSSPALGKYAPSHQLGGAPVTLGTSLTGLQMEQRTANDVKPNTFPELTGDWTIEGVIRGFGSEFASTVFSVNAPNYGGAYIQASGQTGGTTLYARVWEYTNVPEIPTQTFLFADGVSTRSDLPIHWAFTRSVNVFTFYMQGQVVPDAFNPATRVTWLPLSSWVVDHGDEEPRRGRIGEIAIYDRALSAAEILAHHTAAAEPWIGDGTGERVNRILDQVGFPAAWRNVNVGQTTDLGAILEPLESKRALDVLRKVDETEMGFSFVTAAGVWRFIGRRDLRTVTSKATFGDATGEVPYADLVPDYSEADVIRTATITREGGNPQTYTDPTAGAGDVIFDGSRDGLMYGTDHEALDAATWLVAEHKDPHLAFRRMTVTGERSTEVMRTISRIDLGDKVVVRRRPPGGGAALERTVVVVGIIHDIDCQARSWRTTYELDPVDTSDYWILEDAVFGQLNSTTVLAF